MLLNTHKKSECTGCGACVAVCPQKCISFAYDDEGFAYPQRDSTCINCGSCHDVCPTKQHKNDPVVGFKQFSVAARHMDIDVWKRSSSGGAFSAICEAYCNEGDGIFGARFEGLSVVHDCVYRPDQIEVFMKSKYVQSDMRDSYHKAKDLLGMNRKVLFSGTPCQVAGLRSFLGREYDNLLCMDLICHGVGSPGVFKKYIEHLEERYGSKVISFSFRNKQIKLGCSIEYIVSIAFENGMQIDNRSDLYNIGFIQALFLRPSCYKCAFAHLNRVGDITIGDFKNRHDLLPWVKGLENLSTIIVNTEKGKQVFNLLDKYMEIYQVPIEDIVSVNNPLGKRTKMNNVRNAFFDNLRIGMPIDRLLGKYVDNPGPIMTIWTMLPDRMRAIIKRRVGWSRK